MTERPAHAAARAHILRRARRSYAARACLALLATAALIAVWVLGCRYAQSDYAHAENMKRHIPSFIYYGMMVLIPLVLAYRLRLHDVLTDRSLRAKITAVQSTTVTVRYRDIDRRVIPNLSADYRKDVRRYHTARYAVALETDKRRFLFIGDANMAFAQANFKVGDEIEYVRGATFVWNLTRAPERPYCPACGMLAAPNEQHCYACRCPLISAEQQPTAQDAPHS